MSDKKLQSLFNALAANLTVARENAAKEQKAGLIRSAKDGIIEIESLVGLQMGEVVKVPEANVDALVVQVGRDQAYAVLLEPTNEIASGQIAVSDGRILGIKVSEKIMGRVVNPLGKDLDEQGEVKGGKIMPLEAPAPSVISRQPVSEPVQTGIAVVDALIPIGRGQRELIIGDRQTGKSALALDTIVNQQGQDMICVYVSVGQRDSKTTQVINRLKKFDAMEYTVVVSSSAADPAILQFLAPYAGVAIAEYFMQQGKDVLVVYDDLSKHALAYREVSLLLRKPPGREAYPGDVFYIHSRLLERAARLNKDNGGGSITALPIIETQAGDVSAYIPTNVISITDGQIFLESKLFYQGIRPAVNVGISVSRVGSSAQTKIMKQISGKTKLDLAQYYELAAFSQFASELDEASRQQLTRGERLVESLKQKEGSPFSLWQESLILWVAMAGYLDKVELKEVPDKLDSLLNEFAKNEKVVAQINDSKELTDSVKAAFVKVAEKLFGKLNS